MRNAVERPQLPTRTIFTSYQAVAHPPTHQHEHQHERQLLLQMKATFFKLPPFTFSASSIDYI